MGTIGYALLGILGAGALAAVGYWIHRAVANTVALNERDAALRVEQEHAASLEAQAAADRAARAKEFDARNDQVRTASDAASLLHDEFN